MSVSRLARLRILLGAGLTGLLVTLVPSVHSHSSAVPKAGPGVRTQLSPAEISRRYPGLKPFPRAPMPPLFKSVNTSGPLPPVITRIPTGRKIVFVTIDDGWEKDARLAQLIEDLDVPVTMFLTEAAIKSDRDYFRRLQRLGNGVHNHTLTHPQFSKISSERRRTEICDQNDRLESEFGTRPSLFRPPYGDPYFTPYFGAPGHEPVKNDIQRYAGECGIRAVVLWEASMQKQDLQYRENRKTLRPGDIILTHFMKDGDVDGAQRMINLFRKIQDQGFTVARLEDYL